MTLQAAQSVVSAGLTPTSYSPTVSDTISANDIIPGGGCVIRLTTTGTGANFSVLDPNLTAQGNAGTVVAVVLPATGVRYVFVPPSAVNNATGVATYTLSSVTGLTAELIKF